MNSFKAAVRRHRLIFGILILALLILGLREIFPARANGVMSSITNGAVVYGTVTGTSNDQYTFYNPASRSFVLGLSETGAHVATYSPIEYAFIGSHYGCSGGSLYLVICAVDASITGGTWTAESLRYPSGMSGGSYSIQLAQPGGMPTAGTPGGTLYPGIAGSGSLYRGELNVWTVYGIAGTSHPINVTITPTGGPTSYKPEAWAIQPTTLTAVADASTSTYTLNIAASTTVAGLYTIVMFRGDTTYSSASDSAGTYTISVAGAGADLPLDAKPDGTICLTCEANKRIAAGQEPGPQSAGLGSTGSASGGSDPINIATGNVIEQVTDYTTVGTNKLALIRTYNSMSYARNLNPSIMGTNWRTNYDRYLRYISSTQVTAERADGRAINFHLVSSVWTPDTDVDVQLTNSGSTYTLTDFDDTVETYTVSGSLGTLNSIKLPNGYTQTMNYTSGVLTSVSDSYSRSLSFTYTGGVLTGVTTPDTATLTYGYTTVSSASLLTSVTYNTSPSTSQTYVYANTNTNLPWALTSIKDELGNTYASWTYDGTGRATMAEHAGGAGEFQVSYDDSTGNRTLTGPLGNAETYKFTTLQGVSKVSEIDRAANSPVAAATRTFGYDSNGYLDSATDWNGNITHWTNNSHGQPTSITDAYGAGVARTTSITYDSTWVHKPYEITKTNVTIDDRYDSSTGNHLTHELTDTTGGSTNGQTRTWTYTYDGTGELLTAQTPRTDVTVKTTYTYSSGALATITDPAGNVTTWNTVNGSGQPTKVTDPNSVETDFAYDARNHLTSKTVKASTNEVTSYSYYADEKLDVVTLPDSGSDTITYTYDNAHRVTNVTNGAGETMNYTLDAMGDVTAWNLKNGSSTTEKSGSATFDVLGDKLTSVGSAGATQTTNYTYDGNKNRLSVKDANSQTTSLAWDALNRPSTVTDPYSHTAAPTYNNLDDVTAQTDFNGYSTSFTFDGFHDVISKTSPDTGTATFTFDGDHNVTKRVDARSVETDRTFDKLERPTAETYPSYSSEAIAYTYDSTSGGNKGIGRLTKATDESGRTTFVYDNFGNVTSSVRVIGTQTYTTSYSHDLANRVTQIVYPSGRIVNYTYSTSGYLTQVDTKPSSGGTDTVLASSITHQPFGPILSFTLGNTLSQTNTFDDNYWLDDIVTSNGSTHIQNLTYGYDYAGNLTSITDNLAAGRDETYTVDDLNRLHTASGAYGSRTYTYDNNGNRSTWYNGTITRTSTLTTSTNLLASITDGTNTRSFTYSASGNIATDNRVMDGGAAESNTYGGRDRLESLSVSSVATTYKINALGERVQKATTSLTTDYQYDNAHHLIGEYNDSTDADIVEYVWMEGQLLAQIDSSGNIYYVHSNQVNAPQKITNSSMTIVWDYETEPFGEYYANPTNTEPTNHRFPGQYADAEDLLSYNLNRDYDPTLGRYIQADFLGLNAGPNLFSYSGQSPAQNIDPSGRFFQAVVPIIALPAEAFPAIPFVGAIAGFGGILTSQAYQAMFPDLAAAMNGPQTGNNTAANDNVPSAGGGGSGGTDSDCPDDGCSEHHEQLTAAKEFLQEDLNIMSQYPATGKNMTPGMIAQQNDILNRIQQLNASIAAYNEYCFPPIDPIIVNTPTPINSAE
jgi:RHS repeat-associated protein